MILANPGTNYGAHLQAFATQNVVDQFNLNNEIFDLSKISGSSHLYFDWGSVIYFEKAIMRKLLRKKHALTDDKQFHQNKKMRVHLAKDFRNRRLHNIRVFNTYEELVKETSGLSAVMIGSDQMWLPGID